MTEIELETYAWTPERVCARAKELGFAYVQHLSPGGRAMTTTMLPPTPLEPLYMEAMRYAV